LQKLFSYADLKALGIFNSRPTLHRAINDGRFPAGRLVTPNARRWTGEEVEGYLAACPRGRRRQGDPDAPRKGGAPNRKRPPQ
jgi:predicted DNA-binding transcriptional regulator AlpA